MCDESQLLTPPNAEIALTASIALESFIYYTKIPIKFNLKTIL